MRVSYCDLCLAPFKENDMYMLRVSRPITSEDINSYYESENAYWSKLKKEIKEICPTCKVLFDKIFELRRDNLCVLANQLQVQFDLSPKNKGGKNERKGQS